MRTFTVSILALLACSFCFADTLDGKELVITGDVSRQTPIYVSADGASDELVVSVENAATGAVYPGTVRGGQLCFIAEGIKGGADCVVRAQPAKRKSTPRVHIVKQQDADALTVTIDGEHFTTYHYTKDYMKPFLWPVNDEGGVGLTRDHPMAPLAEEFSFARDHVHHKSFWTAYGEVNGVDFWGEGKGAGTQRTDKVDFGSGDAFGWIRAEDTWVDVKGNPQLTEIREYRFYATRDDARLFDTLVTLRADHGDALLSDTKEGGLVALRMRPEMCYDNGVITNAQGDVGEGQCWGKPSPWCDYSADMKDVGWRGITVMDNPTNFRAPTSWHVRNYGLMGANCFGYSYFSQKDYNKALMPANGDHTIKKGEALDMKYRIYVHSGDVKQARVAGRFSDYAAGPQASWKK